MRRITEEAAIYSVQKLALLPFFPKEEGARVQLAQTIVKHVKQEELQPLVEALLDGQTWDGIPTVMETLEKIRARRSRRPAPNCRECSGMGWVSFDRADGLSAAKECSCWHIPSDKKQISAPETPALPEAEPPLSEEEKEFIANLKIKVQQQAKQFSRPMVSRIFPKSQQPIVERRHIAEGAD